MECMAEGRWMPPVSGLLGTRTKPMKICLSYVVNRTRALSPFFFCSLVCTVSVNNNDTDFIFQPDVLIRLEGNRARCFCFDTKFLELLESIRLIDFAENA